MQIEVFTAFKTSQSIKTAPAIISVITDEEIEKNVFRNVAEALQSISGIFVSTNHVTQNVSMRGINGGRNDFPKIFKT